MSLKANVITIFSPQLTTDQQPQAPNTQSSFINQIIHPSSLFHTTIFILQLLFLPSVSPPAIAFVDLWPLPPFPLLFRQYSTPEAETNLILKLRLSSFRIRWAEKVGYYAVSKIEKALISSVRPNDTYQNYVVDEIEKALISAVSFSALFVWLYKKYNSLM